MNPNTYPDTPYATQAELRIGVFDSGLGGLSVLRAIRQELPLAKMLYAADSGHAPYGEKQVAEIVARSEHIAAFLIEQGAQAIVIACNTATAHAVEMLRQRWPNTPIIGVEPGVKPAVQVSKNKKVGVLATPATLNSDRFQALIARHGQGAQITLQACPGLAKEIEQGDLNSVSLNALVAKFSTPVQTAGCDTIVLGCTHYPFVRHLFEKHLGADISIIDTSEAVARRVRALLAARPAVEEALQTAQGASLTQFWTSGDPIHLNRTVQSWFGYTIQAQILPNALA